MAILLVLLAAGCDDGSSNNDNDSLGDSEMVTCSPGAEGCECAAGGECVTGLTCSAANICEADSCLAGALGCACTDAGMCSNSGDECVGDVCVPRSQCTAELGCACNDDGTCGAGLTCDTGLCRAPNGVVIRASGGDARACDILVETTDGRHVGDTVFVAGTRGQARNRNERNAVAVIRTEDSALEGVVGTMLLAGDDPADPSTITPLNISCHDRLGEDHDQVTITFE